MVLLLEKRFRRVLCEVGLRSGLFEVVVRFAEGCWGGGEGVFDAERVLAVLDGLM